MARPSTVTLDDVARAAAQLQTAGGNVTVAGVTDITGGSYTTVGRLLREWRGEARPTEAVGGEPAELPATIAKILAAVGAAVAVALGEARAEEGRSRDAAVAAVRAEAEAAHREATAALDAVRGDAEDLAAHADQLLADLGTARAAQVAADDRARKAEAEATALRQQIDSLLGQLATAKAEAVRVAHAEPKVTKGKPKPKPKEKPEVAGIIRDQTTSKGQIFSAPEGALLRDGLPTGATITRLGRAWTIHLPDGSAAPLEGGGRQGTLHNAIMVWEKAATTAPNMPA